MLTTIITVPAAVGENVRYWYRLCPVSYTHLDVYKRQAYLREAQAKVEHRVANSGMAVLLDAGMEKGIHPAKKQVAGCLLYTSRCV